MLALGAAPSQAADWTGRYSVYTQGSFSYQHTNYTCVGASVQMMLNMINGTAKHSATAQMTYWQLRPRPQPLRQGKQRRRSGRLGCCPGALWRGQLFDQCGRPIPGWPARLAAAMRATDRPVGLFVDAGGHAWVMTGFEATADPAGAASYKVTAVQAMGPLYPDGTINGKPYDPAPGTWLSLDQLRKKFTPMRWPKAAEWNGRWIAVVPD